MAHCTSWLVAGAHICSFWYPYDCFGTFWTRGIRFTSRLVSRMSGCACGCACFHLFWAVLLVIHLLWSFLAFMAGQIDKLLYYVSPRAAGYGVFNTFQSFRECWYFLCRYIRESNKRLLFETGLKSLSGILSWTGHLVTLSITALCLKAM